MKIKDVIRLIGVFWGSNYNSGSRVPPHHNFPWNSFYTVSARGISRHLRTTK